MYIKQPISTEKITLRAEVISVKNKCNTIYNIPPIINEDIIEGNNAFIMALIEKPNFLFKTTNILNDNIVAVTTLEYATW